MIERFFMEHQLLDDLLVGRHGPVRVERHSRNRRERGERRAAPRTLNPITSASAAPNSSAPASTASTSGAGRPALAIQRGGACDAGQLRRARSNEDESQQQATGNGGRGLERVVHSMIQ